MYPESKSAFHILQQSPHDFDDSIEGSLAAPQAPDERTWVPSHYTFRAHTTDGRLVLWNSYTGAVSAFQADQSPAILEMLQRKGFKAEPEGIVKYLIDRGFIIDQSTDEYARFQYSFGQAQHRSDALDMILLSSEDCNFRCVYCYEKFARGTMRPHVREGIKKYLASKLRGLRILSVGWFGGEPLYGFKAIEDLAPYFLSMAQENSIHYSSNMTTNGYLLTPDVAEKLLSWNVTSYQITLDGPPRCHDHSRPTREGGASFDTILSNLRNLARRPETFDINLRVNFSPQNAVHMDEFLEIVEQEFRDDPRFRLRFHAVGKWGGDNDENLDVCGTEDVNRLNLEFERAAKEKGLTLSDGFKAVSRMGSQVCYAARPNSLIVGAEGKIMKCTVVLDQDERNVVGMINRNGELTIDDGKLAPWVAPYFESDRKCQRCAVLPVCQGFSCPLPRITNGERPCIPTKSNWRSHLLGTAQRVEPVRRRTV